MTHPELQSLRDSIDNIDAALIGRLRELAAKAKLDPDFAEKFLNFIVKEVIRHHEAIAKSKA